MADTINHSIITKLHKDIVRYHKDLKGFYRFNLKEIDGRLRAGVKTPVLMLESYSSQVKHNANKTTNFKERNISFLLLDFTGAADNFDKQEEVLTKLEIIGDDICTLLESYRINPDHWMYGLFDAGTFRMEKVGPIFDNMFGWNILYDVTSKNPLCFNTSKWDFDAPEVP